MYRYSPCVKEEEEEEEEEEHYKVHSRAMQDKSKGKKGKSLSSKT